MGNVKSLTGFAFAPFLIGMIGLFNLMHKPRFEAIHTVDVVQLLASGACFGVALASLIMGLRGQRPN